jgi:peptide/nickel transport system substrate-binding protein
MSGSVDNYWTRRLSRRGLIRNAALTSAGIATLAAFGCGRAGSTSGTTSSTSASSGSGKAFQDRTADGQGSGGTLIVAMTATNLPIPDSQVTEGGEGSRFVGVQIYQGLTRYDLSTNDHLPTPGPGLAKSWDTPGAGSNVWTFHLRPGVTFHDGANWDADAAVFAFDRVLNPNFQYYSKPMAASAAQWVRYFKAYQKVDDMTLQIETKEPYSLLPWAMTSFNFPSPASVKQWGDNYFQHPAGTGPFRMTKFETGQSMELVPFDKYWLGKAKLDKLILRPIPQDSTRLAELKTGGVNWAEVPPHDSVQDLSGSGYQVITGPYPHIWPYVLNNGIPPFNNKLARQAINYAVDRQGMATNLLNNLAEPTGALLYPQHPWFGNPTAYTYDPKKAKQLMAQAGYPNGFTVTIKAPSSGSGNMWPVEMNQLVQKNLADVGVNLKVQTVEWQSLLTEYTADRTTGFGPDINGFCYSLNTSSPDSIQQTFAGSGGPNVNDAQYDNPQMDSLFQQLRNTYDYNQQVEILKQVHAMVTDEAPWLYVVHDMNARAFSSKVRGVIDPQSWQINMLNAWVAS